MIEGVFITPQNIIETPGGDVMHAMKEIDAGFYGFGEAYFSEVSFNSIKAWKRHKQMTLNLVVPVGKIKFVLFDNREGSNDQFQEITISRNILSVIITTIIPQSQRYHALNSIK